jgi:hypothetical protein
VLKCNKGEEVMIEFLVFTIFGSIILQIIFGEGEKERENWESTELNLD